MLAVRGQLPMSRAGVPRAAAESRSCGFPSASARQSSAPWWLAAARASRESKLSLTPSSRSCAIGQARSRNEIRPMVSGSAVMARVAEAATRGSARPKRRDMAPVTAWLLTARHNLWYQSPVVKIRAPGPRRSGGSSPRRSLSRRWSSTMTSTSRATPNRDLRLPPGWRAWSSHPPVRWLREASSEGRLFQRGRSAGHRRDPPLRRTLPRPGPSAASSQPVAPSARGPRLGTLRRSRSHGTADKADPQGHLVRVCGRAGTFSTSPR